MKKKIFFLSVGAYICSFITMYLWDVLPVGLYKDMACGLIFLFLAIGAFSAAALSSDKWKNEGISDETYEEILQMVEERKRQLELEAENKE